MGTILELKEIELYVPDGDGIRKVISDYSLSLSEGEIKTIKTDSREETHGLYGIITGDKEPTAGTVIRSKGRIGRIRCGTEVFSELQVYENISLAFWGRYRKGTAREHGFDPRMETAELSRAERIKLVFLQRYLQDPVYIAAEDPFDGLREDETDQVMSFIKRETWNTGIPVVIIETEGESGRDD